MPRKHDHPSVETRKPCIVPESLRRFSLHWRCHAAVEGETHSPEAVVARAAYRAMLDHGSGGPRAGALREAYMRALAEAHAAELRDADIVFTTCVSCRRQAVAQALAQDGAPSFAQVIIDEAGQATEPEALCPLAFARQARQICLFGDHKQLRPILKSRQAGMAGLEVSLFERLVLAGQASPAGDACFLAQQYRMHPKISVFPSAHFYDARLHDDPSVLARLPGLLERRPPGTETNPSAEPVALLFWDFASSENASKCSAEEVRSVRTCESGVGSRSHLAEATCVAELARSLAAAVGPGSVGILTWYNAQVAAISELLGPSAGIHVGSIATAQGSEWDYVLLSTVRRGASNNLGIVSDPHNLNVALTRARLGLVVFGHGTTLSKDHNWAAFINHCHQCGAVTSAAPMVSDKRELLEEAVSRSLRYDLRVILHGLQSSPEMNGLEGVVKSHEANKNGRWEVDVLCAGDLRKLSLKPANLQLVAARSQRCEKPARRKFNGLSALVSADRRGGEVEFSKKLSLKASNLENLVSGAPLKRGAKVRLHSLTAAANYNGLVGKIRSERPGSDGRWEVEVTRSFDVRPGQVEATPGKSGLQVTSHDVNNTSHRFTLGRNVVVQGLSSQAEHNGEWGVITSSSPNGEGRWEVEIFSHGVSKRLLLKPENIAPEATGQ